MSESDKMKKTVKDLTKGMKNFVNDFHRHLKRQEDKNYVASAFSAHLVLSMAAYGASGETAEEMRKVLYLPNNDSEALTAFETIIDNINQSNEIGCVMEVANKIYPSESFKVKDSFKKITKEYFQSECQTLNFENKEESAGVINKWCSDKTHDKIRQIINPKQISEFTRMILINAVYFKGNWKLPFNVDDTEPHEFHVNTSLTVLVPMMSIQAEFQYKELKELDAQSIVLNYEDTGKYMEIIVPRKIDGLSAIEQNLEKTTLSREKSRYAKVNFKMPKLTIETELDLEEHLEKMGLRKMFDQNEADFSNTTDELIHVSRVIQKAFIQVDESGCEAAAATYISEDEDMCYGCFDYEEEEIIQMKADRPFLFRIYDDNSRTFIFVGMVVNPSK